MKSDFIIALTQLAAERNLPREIVLSAIEAALASAYKKDSIAAGQDISVKLDPGSGDVSVFVVKTVVEEIEDPLLELSVKEARKVNPDANVGDVIQTSSLPHSAGRIAAQTAKQVVIQRLREAERDLVFQEYADKEGEVFTVTVQKMEPRQLVVELGRAEAVLPQSEQPPFERYRVGQKMRVLLQSVRQTNQGPEIVVSRTDKLLLKRLFEMEVPEIYNGSVEIMGISREAGSRSKVAVFARQEGVDAVGSCVGLRGIRIQNIVNELHGEKIDVVDWVNEPAAYISRALSPSLVMRVDLDVEEQSAVAVVPENQLSLAIGKEGQNARLTARLTGWKVDIKSNVEMEAIEASSVKTNEVLESADAKTDDELPVDQEAELGSQDAVDVVADKNNVEELTSLTGQEGEVEDVNDGTTTNKDDEDIEILEDIALKELIAEVEDSPSQADDITETVDDTATSIDQLPDDVWSVKDNQLADAGVIRFREDIVELGGSDSSRRNTTKKKRKRGSSNQQSKRR
tara:strand:- start:503 stop:2047 length:1545 start_codon:yes stop_codon:yes gene_type:complete